MFQALLLPPLSLSTASPAQNTNVNLQVQEFSQLWNVAADTLTFLMDTFKMQQLQAHYACKQNVVKGLKGETLHS